MTVASAGAFTGVQLSAVLPAPAVALSVVAGSVPTVADAVADPEPPLKYAAAGMGVNPISSMHTPQAAISRLRCRPLTEFLVDRRVCTRRFQRAAGALRAVLLDGPVSRDRWV